VIFIDTHAKSGLRHLSAATRIMMCILGLGAGLFAVRSCHAAAHPLEALRVVSGAGQAMRFVTADGRRFTPQGVNWVAVSPGTEATQHEVSFTPDYYLSHRKAIHQSLRRMARDGFTYVRLRLDARTISAGVATPGLSRPYMDNVIDFVRTAAGNGLYVELGAQWLPAPYYQLVSQSGLRAPDKRNTSGINEMLLSQSEAYAYGRYIGDVLSALRTADPHLLSAIYCVDIWNELGFESGDLPFSKTSGPFTDESGLTIDLSDRVARQKLADRATTRWIDGVIAVARKASPGTLFTSSVFTPIDVYRSGYVGVWPGDAKWGDPRQPLRLSAIEASQVDLLEIHLYPAKTGATIDAQMASLEYAPARFPKPIVVGETGAFKTQIPDRDQAAATVQGMMHQACAQKLSGWAYWTWDTDEQKDLWNLREQDGYLERRLAPRYFNWCGK
jgi:hypothetical protein